MNNSPHFDPVWLQILISGDEGQRVDFKKIVHKVDTDEKKLEFARHLIALANVARRIGEPCWMVFGVDNETRELQDVRDQYPGKEKPKFWDNPGITTSRRQKDGVELPFYNIARDWIDPLPQFHLEYGELDGVFLSYLQIDPSYSSRPFSLKRVPDKNSTYTVGTVFLRYGSQSLPVEPSEVEYLVTKSRAAYLTDLEWANLINHYKAGEFLDAQKLAPTFHHKVAGSGAAALDKVIELLDAGKRRFVISAEAGHGKTVLLQRIAFALAVRHPSQLENKYFAQPREPQQLERIVNARSLEVVPSLPVPVFMDLRMYFADISEFKTRLLRQLCEIAQQDRIESLDALWRIPGSRWVILLDGVDELANSGRAGAQLQTWVEGLRENVQVILTARPYAAFEWKRAEHISLAQLSDDETRGLLRDHLQSRIEEPAERVVIEEQTFGKLERDPDLLTLLRCPRAMNGFLVGVLDKYTPVKSQVDRDRIQVVASTPTTIKEGQGPLPFLSVEPNLVQDKELNNEESHENKAPEENPFVFSIPSLAVSVQQIVEYMIGEEIKRQKGLGKTRAELDAANAQDGLRRVAWQTDWDSEHFDWYSCKAIRSLTQRSLVWNQNIGFIRTQNSETYYFYCMLLKHYEAAAHALRRDETRIKGEFETRRKSSEGRTKILDLLNELRTENGKEEIQIS